MINKAFTIEEIAAVSYGQEMYLPIYTLHQSILYVRFCNAL